MITRVGLITKEALIEERLPWPLTGTGKNAPLRRVRVE